MANEFIIKNGLVVETGGIDVTGSLTLSDDLVVQGSITAESYIVSSSVTHMTTSFSSGSTIFGDDSGDTHEFTGSVSISSTLNLDSVVNASADTDKFLVLDSSNNVDFRTGAEVRSDISAVASINSETPDGSGDVSLDTDNISEGSSNLYYTDTRVRAAISVNSESPDAGGDISITTDEVSEGSTNLYYTDGRVKTKLNTESVISGSSQVTISDTSGYTSFSSSIASDITSVSSPTLQNVTDNGSSTTNVITFPNFVLSTPTNNNAGSDKILVLDGANRSKIRTRDQLRDDIGALQASRTPQIVVTAAEVLDEALTGVYIPFSGINIFPDSNTTAYSRFHAPYDGFIKEIIVHPHEAAASGTCTITPAIDGTGATSVQATISATAGTPTTFTFGSSGYSFSDGDDIVLEFDRESNTRSKGFSFTIVFIMDTTS